MITIETIKTARERIAPHIYRTPLLRLNSLERYLGCRAYGKMESLQRTNSFKVRGALNRVLSLSPEELERGILTASSGNHGKAVSYAARELGASAHIVVPDNAPKVKVDGIREFGGEIIFCKAAERFEVAAELVKERGWTYIPPFDDYGVMSGQGTSALEIFDDLPDVDCIAVPIGGGGLIGGISVAAKSLNPKVKVFGVEPANIARYSKSIAAGKAITLPADSASVADGLRTLTPGEKNFPIIKDYVDEVAAVDEEYILKATRLMLMTGKLLAEPSSCVAIGAVLQGALKFKPSDKVAFLISGANIGMDQFASFRDAVV
jgi:threonine dehydratase